MQNRVLRSLAVAVASIAALAGASGSGLAGCAAARAVPQPQSPQPARAVVRGDWDDVEAAIWTAAGQMEIAVERIQVGGGSHEGRGDDTLEATLRTILAEPVTVIARRLPPEDAPEAEAAGARIQLEAQFGRFAEPDARATRLLELIERRLTQLQGVGAAPIR